MHVCEGEADEDLATALTSRPESRGCIAIFSNDSDFALMQGGVLLTFDNFDLGRNLSKILLTEDSVDSIELTELRIGLWTAEMLADQIGTCTFLQIANAIFFYSSEDTETYPG